MAGFYTYRTMFDLFRNAFPKLKDNLGRTPLEGYRRMLEGNYFQSGIHLIMGRKVPESVGVWNNQCLSELAWHQSDKPYFCIHPELIPVFSRCRMDIPCRLVKFPKRFKAFSIRLPQENNPLVIDKDHRVQSILCWRLDDDTAVSLQKQLPSIPIRKPGDRRLILWLDINETESFPAIPAMHQPVYTYRILCWTGENDTIEHALTTLPFSKSLNEGVPVPEELVQSCIKLMVSVCFLFESNDPVVVPDVLVADRYKYWLSNDPKIWHDLHQRARDKGKFSWLVGVDEMFSSPTPPAEAFTKDAGSRKLNFAHFRNGHWHIVWHGVGKTQAKVVWYRPTIVGKGLPFRKG